MKQPQITPRNDRILVRPFEAERKTPGGLVIPDVAQEKAQRGTVVAVGPGILVENGQRIPLDLSEGDVVLFSKYHGQELKIESEDYLLVQDADVLAVLGKAEPFTKQR